MQKGVRANTRVPGTRLPEDRFATAAELSQALSQYLSRVEQSSRNDDGPSSSLPSKLLSEYRLIELIGEGGLGDVYRACLLYTSPSPRDRTRSRMPSSA